MTKKNAFDTYVQIAALWESELEKYSDEQFAVKPSPESWSIGQVYEHLVMGGLNYHSKQIEQCMLSDENQCARKTFSGTLIFLLHAFPPIRIKVPPSPTYTPKQPENKERIKAGLRLLKKKLQDLSGDMDHAVHSGKTKHRALGYLDAQEWYRLIVMHFRHHMRQKKRIDLFLKGKRRVNTTGH
jgi:hypothetical protein